MSRLIDADEVIKFYANFINEHGFDLKDARFSIRDIEMNLWNIPTVEPTVNEWIPCSERLPEEKERVLVSTDMNEIQVMWHDDGYWYSDIAGLYFEDEVYAWMELSKPYEVKEE